MPSPFEMGRAVGGNISKGLEQGREQNAISQVLAEIASEKDPIAGQNKMNQLLLNISPERREMAQQVIGQQVNQLKTQQIQQSHDAMARDFIKDFPDSPEVQIAARILSMNVPPEQKPALLKSMLGTAPYRAAQQKRLDIESARKIYGGKIKQAQEEIKSLNPRSEKDRSRITYLREQIELWQDAQDTVTGTLQALPEWNPSNESHVAERNRILKEQGGDQEKAGKIMLKRFKLP